MITIGHAAFEATITSYRNKRFTLRNRALVIGEHVSKPRLAPDPQGRYIQRQTVAKLGGFPFRRCPSNTPAKWWKCLAKCRSAVRAHSSVGRAADS
jgi:hypothetical protein